MHILLLIFNMIVGKTKNITLNTIYHLNKSVIQDKMHAHRLKLSKTQQLIYNTFLKLIAVPSYTSTPKPNKQIFNLSMLACQNSLHLFIFSNVYSTYIHTLDTNRNECFILQEKMSTQNTSVHLNKKNTYSSQHTLLYIYALDFQSCFMECGRSYELT